MLYKLIFVINLGEHFTTLNRKASHLDSHVLQPICLLCVLRLSSLSIVMVAFPFTVACDCLIPTHKHKRIAPAAGNHSMKSTSKIVKGGLVGLKGCGNGG